MKEHVLPEEVMRFVQENQRMAEKLQDQLLGGILLYCKLNNISETPWKLSADGSRLIAEDKKE